MTTISAKSILASRHAITGKRVDTLLLRYPRWIHAEGRTHRQLRIGEEEITNADGEEGFPFYYEDVRTPCLMEDPNLSRNASSSRAIPVSKLIKDVLDDPAVPLFWGANQKGMQATQECNALVWYEGLESNAKSREEMWLQAMRSAVSYAEAFDDAGYHKQIVNRLLEPFSHITVVVTATEWTNFFALRRHKDAEPHIHLLADRMWEAMEGAHVQTLQPGDWHLPFVNDYGFAGDEWSYADKGLDLGGGLTVHGFDTGKLLKLSVARCASTSYKTVEGFDMTLDRAVALHDKLVASAPLHASPCEHQCFADDWIPGEKGPYGEWRVEHWAHPHLHGNLKGFVQYRKTLVGECQ